MATAAPCDWDVIECGCTLALDPEESGFSETDLYAVEMATFVLWALSGRQFGCCELSFRPCRRDCRSGLEGGPWGARLVDGAWINLPCKSCSGACACSEVCEVRIPNAPVCSIEEVVLDGVVIDESLYRLEDDSWLVLLPEAGCFPSCQDMSVPLGEPGTSGVRYTWGTPVPTAGRRAAGALACEIVKACRGTACALPKRTATYSLMGTPVPMLDPMEFFDKGRTGIYEVDLFLSAVNPLGRMAGARVMSPDSEPRSRDMRLPD